jgi:hypothetical protein
MIPKPFVPLEIIEAQEEKPLVLDFEDFGNNVARFNSKTRQWEFKNGQMMNCGVNDGFIAGEQ